MGILTHLGQTFTQANYTNTSNGTLDDATTSAIIVGFMLLTFIISLALYLTISLCLMSIFKKAGVKQWIAWVPFYNSWKILEIGGQQGFWAVLSIVPIVSLVSLVYIYIAMYHIGIKLGKDGIFVLLAILLPYVWYIWLAVDKSVWNDQASTAPSLAQ